MIDSSQRDPTISLIIGISLIRGSTLGAKINAETAAAIQPAIDNSSLVNPRE